MVGARINDRVLADRYKVGLGKHWGDNELPCNVDDAYMCFILPNNGDAVVEGISTPIVPIA
jgi:hypothetical protein